MIVFNEKTKRKKLNSMMVRRKAKSKIYFSLSKNEVSGIDNDEGHNIRASLGVGPDSSDTGFDVWPHFSVLCCR